MTHSRSLTLHLSGPRVASGRLSVDDLSRLAQGLQLALKRTGLRETGRPGKAPGRLPKEIEAACSLDLVRFTGGSVNLTLELREPPRPEQPPLFTIPDPGEQALDALLDDLATVASDAPLPSRLELGVVEPLLDMTGLLERGVDEIAVYDPMQPATPLAVLNRHVRARLRSFIERPAPTETGVVGLLLEIDFKDATAELHEATGNVVRLSFSPDEDERLRSAAKSRVRAFGTAQRESDGRITQLRLSRLEILEELSEVDSFRLPTEGLRTEWTSSTDPFLGVEPLHDVSVLIGGLPDDRDASDILADLRALRRPRPEQD